MEMVHPWPHRQRASAANDRFQSINCGKSTTMDEEAEPLKQEDDKEKQKSSSPPSDSAHPQLPSPSLTAVVCCFQAPLTVQYMCLVINAHANGPERRRISTT